MNEENVIDQAVVIAPDEEITEEKKIILLNQWREKVQKEVDDYAAEKDKIMEEYKRIKSRMDKILGVRLKKMKKYDAVINSRKKVLADIIKEISIATNTNDQTGNASQSGGSGEESPSSTIST